MSEDSKNLFKISGVGIDTTTMKFRPIESGVVYNYLYTSISANNDYIISDYVKSMSDSSLIVGIDFLDGIDEIIINHLRVLGREKLDLLLIDSSCDLSYLSKNSINRYTNQGIGIKNPTSVDQIKELSKYNIKAVAFDLSPFHFNYDMINYCNENNIMIISFNPFGGNISSSAMIEAFSVPYLLSFSSNYSDIVFLSGRDTYYSDESKKYLESLIGKETKPIFTLRKNINKLIKPIKKVVNTSISFEDSININYDSPELIYNYEDIHFTLGNKLDNNLITIDNETMTDIEKEVKSLFDVSHIPSDISLGGLFAIYRYQAFNYLSVKYLESLGWKTEYVRLGDNMIAIKLEREQKKGWFKRSKETEYVNYFFSMLNNTPIFINIQNSFLKS